MEDQALLELNKKLDLLTTQVAFLSEEARQQQRRRQSQPSHRAGVAGGVAAAGIFAWRYYVNDVWSWDLFAVAVTMAGVKLAAMLWFRITD